MKKVLKWVGILFFFGYPTSLWIIMYNHVETFDYAQLGLLITTTVMGVISGLIVLFNNKSNNYENN